MSDDNSGLMAEFEEFLAAKREREQQANADDDYDIDVWDSEGRGARLRRSHAKPFLQSLGIDLDPEPADSPAEQAKPPKNPASKPPSAGRSSGDGTARKYFAKKAPK